MKKILSEIKIEFNKISQISEEELMFKIEKVKNRRKKESLEKILPEWFALVQEMSLRKIGLKHFDTQLLAGISLHEGKIIEMKTGEGKTLASTLPVSLNALEKKGVHVVTVNEYLAERDQKWMGKIYEGLGLTVGLVKSTNNINEKQQSYLSDITYLTNSEVVFDHLRDSSAYSKKELVQRPFNYCVIDEIDSILIDEARTPLILSTSKGSLNHTKLRLAKKIANQLNKDIDFQLDEKRKEINLTEIGYEKTKKKVGKKSLYDLEEPWMLEILNALKAQYIFKRNKDYIILKNKVLIVDEFTGRIMEDRRWSLGIHEAIETKENVEIGDETKTKNSITYQNFFTLYPKLAGMTGTAKTTEKEFNDIYNLEVIEIPTAKPMIRKDLPDLVYQSELAKWKAVLKKAKECFQIGQPILIGTTTVEKSEFLSELFQIAKIPHQVLNAKPENVRRESEIVAQAGEGFRVTIATNMAGRGTDIILGGNPIFKVKQKLTEILVKENEGLTVLEHSDKMIKIFLQKIKEEYEQNSKKLELDIENLPYSLETSSPNLKNLYDYVFAKISKEWEKENRKVKELGGLVVIGTERHETRRIDNQLRGRAGRQGDPGISQFFVSLEDDLIKVFGGDNIRGWVEYLLQDKDLPLESDMLTRSLENAQKKVESYNYDLRKNVFQYDDILNRQRKVIFKARQEILSNDMDANLFLRYMEMFVDKEKKPILNLNIKTLFQKNISLEKTLDCYATYSNCSCSYADLWISNDLRLAQSNFYENGLLKITRSNLILSIIDFYWTEHIERMNYIRETINWRSYGQQNPLAEYTEEASKSFKLMFKQIRSCMIYYFLNNEIN
uniref:Protein translocase subunit SecA n=1 Tax=Neotessella volvocina TaxID=52559 RepID=A0A3G2R0Y5_9STRA|nr:preprotein translocase subunit SecA [Neotessella volvocina]AYO28761.1 preprotein translocase subunit SecA [Neotessella volvocina]